MKIAGSFADIYLSNSWIFPKPLVKNSQDVFKLGMNRLGERKRQPVRYQVCISLATQTAHASGLCMVASTVV